MTNVVTLRMDEASQAYFERLRQAHYPAYLNRIGAHLTLFHTLPDTSEVYQALRSAGESQTPFAMQVTGLRMLGRGVAYQLASRELLALHAELSEAFRKHLSAQDKQRFMPHVVVQNKATPERAKVLMAELQAEFQPRRVAAVGLQMWHYLGGPWELAESFGFQGETAKRSSPAFSEE